MDVDDIDIEAAMDMTVDELRSLLIRLGRNSGPAALGYMTDEDALDDATIAALVGDVWAAAEYPENGATADEWVAWFRTAPSGMIAHDDGTPIPAPTEVPVLYRGGTIRDRMSWTSSLEVARKFARGIAFRPTDGTVWAIRDLPPELVLAHVDGRNEHEWVIDIQAYTGEPEVIELPEVGAVAPAPSAAPSAYPTVEELRAALPDATEAELRAMQPRRR